jgi:hypothetical protein
MWLLIEFSLILFHMSLFRSELKSKPATALLYIILIPALALFIRGNRGNP